VQLFARQAKATTAAGEVDIEVLSPPKTASALAALEFCLPHIRNVTAHKQNLRRPAL
jgi:hypothetical protein